MRDYTKSLVSIHVAVFLFGFGGLFGKFFIDISPIIIIFWRVIFAIIPLFLMIRYLRIPLRIDSKKDFLSFLFIGILLAIHWGTFVYSVQISTVAVALITLNIFPVFTAILEPIIFRERFRFFPLLLALVSVIGIFLIIPQLQWNNAITKGAFWGIISGLSFSLLTILNRARVQQYSSLVVTLYQDIVTAVILLPLLFFIPPPLFTQNTWLLLILFGVVFTAGAHSLFIRGMTHVKAKYASIIASLGAVYGIIFAFFLLNEVPNLRTILGGIIILGTATIVSYQSHAVTVNVNRE